MDEIIISKESDDSACVSNPDEITISFSTNIEPKKGLKKTRIYNLQPKIPLYYSEVQPKFLYHLHGSWIKTAKVAGFLKKISQDTIILHSLHEGLIEISIDDGPFYIKKDDMNYCHLLLLIKDYEKNIADEKHKLMLFKKKINDMLASGKIKFTSSSS